MNIWLTGGTSGIGAALKHGLQLNNHNVVAPTRADLDLSRDIDVSIGDQDAIILCAGIDLGGQQSFVTQKQKDWQETMQVNLISNMHIMQQYQEQRGDKWSKIIVFGSTVTDNFWPGKLVYTTSKLALEGFCKGLRQELPKNIGLTVIRPGLTRTGFHRRRHHNNITKEQEQQWYSSMPCLEPDVFVSPVLDLLSDRSHTIREIRIEA
jgi:NADP-dependent 3-hydroxy acid dehydrogenase YdfG